MERDAHYFVVGVFVSVLLVLLLCFVIWLAGTHDTHDYERYTVYFTDPVSGLNEGASVQYKGVAVGKVLDIRIAPERHDLIKVDIQVNENTPVRSKTQASLATQGVTGLVFMELTTQPGDTQPPPQVEGEDYPVLQGSGSELTKLLRDIPTINKQVLDITTKLNNLLTSQNMETMSTTIANVERMTRDMNGLLSQDNVANASTAMKNISDASVNFGPMIDRLEKTADQLDKTTAALNDMIVKNKAHIDKFTDQGLSQITATTHEAQAMAKSVRQVADKLKQDPSSVIYKPSYQGVEVRK